MQRILFGIILFTIIACNRQTELQKLCKDVRKAPQTAFPSGTDTKWKLIKELEKIKDPDLPDSVKNIFKHIDTSIQGYRRYHFALLNLLVKPDSKKSLKILAEIFKENSISDPGCSRVLSGLLHDESLWGDMAISYVTKENKVDFSKVLGNIDVMFPDLANVLGKQPFSDRPILDLMVFGIKAGVLDKYKLTTSKNDLIRYYDYLKFARDELAKRPSKGYSYKGYYESHVPDLLFILKIFEGDAEVDRIQSEAAK